MTRPLTLKWIAALVGGGLIALVAFKNAGEAWNYFGFWHLATEEWTKARVDAAKVEVLKQVKQVSRKVDTASDQLTVNGLQTQRLVVQSGLDRARAERSSVDQALQTIKDRAAIDIMRRRAGQIDDDLHRLDKQVAEIDQQLAAAQNPAGRKRVQERVGPGHGKTDEDEGEPR